MVESAKMQKVSKLFCKFEAMKQLILFLGLLLLVVNVLSQTVQPKFVKYNAFGMGVLPHSDLMIGGNHIAFRKLGFCLSWRGGIKDLLEPERLSDIPYDTLLKSSVLYQPTNSIMRNYSFFFGMGMAVALTKKIPLYVNLGITRKRQYEQFRNLNDQSIHWAVNASKTEYKPSFTAGTFIPLFGRLVLNLSYDYEPQTLFVGLTIRAWDAYEDIDLY